MTGIFEREPGKRWPRSQRFRLSAKGIKAEESYRGMIEAARAMPGRPSFDAARTAWAAGLQVQPNDGLYLVELENRPLTIEEMVKTLETCGSTRQDVRVAIERLTIAGMVEIVPIQANPP